MKKFCLVLALCCAFSGSGMASGQPNNERTVAKFMEDLARPMTAERIAYMLDSYPWLNPKIFNSDIDKLVNFTTPAQLRVKIFARLVPKNAKHKLLLWDAERDLQVKNRDKAYKELPSFWLEAALSEEEEKQFASKYISLINEKMVKLRLQNLAWLEKKGNIAILKSYLPIDQQKRVSARLMHKVGNSSILYANQYDAYKYVGKLVKNEDYKKATNLVLNMDNTDLQPLQADKWWRLRHVLSRENMKNKQYKIAYKLACGYVTGESSTVADAEWLCGWLALRFLHNPSAAIPHFHKVYKVAAMSDTKAKAAYWLWRSYVANKQETEANNWLKIAIAYKGFFYGQVAAMESGKHDASIFINSGQLIDSPSFANAKKHLMIANALQKINNHDLARKFVLVAADYKLDTAQSNALANIVAKNNNTELLVNFAKEIANRHNINLSHGYPVNLSITNNKDRISLYYSIIRQESNFNPAATSPVGAYGLMQLMPKTATMLSKKLKIKANYYRLYPKYNVYSGVAYIDDIKQRFGGYIPAIGAYNAGEKNANKWIELFGDPHAMKDTDSIIDWIESVPFGETRFYIKKVLSNMIIYDSLLVKKKGLPTKISWKNFKHFLS